VAFARERGRRVNRRPLSNSREVCKAGQATTRAAARAHIGQQFPPSRRRPDISPREPRVLPSQRFPASASSGPLNSSSAQAYRPAMSRPINQLSPSPRLQRTRSAPLRSPLSRQTFANSGD
jgi:hypothetical protein